jgi:hypothetical protein
MCMTPGAILNTSAAPEASLDYGQQIYCAVIWVRRPLFDKWQLTDGILLAVSSGKVARRCISFDKHQSESRMVRFDGI